MSKGTTEKITKIANNERDISRSAEACALAALSIIDKRYGHDETIDGINLFKILLSHTDNNLVANKALDYLQDAGVISSKEHFIVVGDR